MRFSERVRKTKEDQEAAEFHALKQQRWAEEAAIKEKATAKLAEQQRQREIMADPRWQQLYAMANDSELEEALRVIWETYAKPLEEEKIVTVVTPGLLFRREKQETRTVQTQPVFKKEIFIDFYSGINEPVGNIILYSHFEYNFFLIRLAFRMEATKIETKSVFYERVGSAISTYGFDRKSGFSIEIPYDRRLQTDLIAKDFELKYGDEDSLKTPLKEDSRKVLKIKEDGFSREEIGVFYSLEGFLDFLALCHSHGESGILFSTFEHVEPEALGW